MCLLNCQPSSTTYQFYAIAQNDAVVSVLLCCIQTILTSHSNTTTVSLMTSHVGLQGVLLCDTPADTKSGHQSVDCIAVDIVCIGPITS